MIPVIPQIRPASKIPGGKYYLASRLVAIMQPHETYIECSAGMFSTLLAKPRSTREIINDLDWFNWNLYVTLRDNGDEFRNVVRALPYTAEIFQHSAQRHFKARERYGLVEPIDWSNARPPSEPNLLDAVDVYVYRRMSRGGRGCRNPFVDSCKKSFAWSKRERGGRPGDENAWITANEVNLPKIIDRLQGVLASNKDADQFYQQYRDDEKALIYDDPTYLHETRKTTRMYGSMEMTTKQHGQRLFLAGQAKCMVMISGYDNNLYRAMLGTGRPGMTFESGRPNLFGREFWRCRRYDMPNNQSEEKKKERRVECVWYNFDAMTPEEKDDPYEAEQYDEFSDVISDDGAGDESEDETDNADAAGEVAPF